jgi:hypothetical protein
VTLDPKDDVVTQVIQSYEGYRDCLDGERRKRLDEMLNLCYDFVRSINAKGEPLPELAVIMTLLLKQHIMIEELKEAVAQGKAQEDRK